MTACGEIALHLIATPQANSMTRMQNKATISSRRDFLLRAGGGFGALALVHLLDQSGLYADEPEQGRPIGSSLADSRLAASAAVPPHFAARAKSVIFLFMDGGPSHIDTFDPKPKVNELAGQPLPTSIKRPITPMGVS